MPSRPPWRSLLAAADSTPSLSAIGRALGFGEVATLTAETRQALGVPETFAEASIAEGPGTLRLLLLVTGEPTALRVQVLQLATRLAARAPHYLWLTLVTATTRAELAVSTWDAGAPRPRVSGLFVNRDGVLSADVDTMEAVAAAAGPNDLLVHARWQELLGREAISRRFYRALERLVVRLAQSGTPGGRPEDRAEIALLATSRLLFLAFLESKGWLDGDRDFLSRVFDERMRAGGGFHQGVLCPLFFGTLNTRPAKRSATARRFGRLPFLNGGLFQRSAAERRVPRFIVDDADWGAFYDELLQRYRFSAQEESGSWSEAAIDPEMLGRAFESLMASRDRRNSGAYFTPQPLVVRVTDAALEIVLEGAGVADTLAQRLLRGDAVSGETPPTLAGTLRSLRLLDPACGSGAFLVYALERLTTMRRAAGDGRPMHVVRRDVLTQNIFGVDINPTAVWLCELRLWLAMVIDQEEDNPTAVTPLPNLDHHVRCGDALLGGDFSLSPDRRDGARLALLRARYARSTGTRKHALARALDREERSRVRALLAARLETLSAERRALVVAARGRDLFGNRRGSISAERTVLTSLRARCRETRAALKALASGGAMPFAFAAHFPDALASGGFDVVIGNPPWVRLHRIPPLLRARLSREFTVYREAAWLSGARAVRAGPGFAAQIDLAALFLERGVALARPGGVLSMLIPAKLWRSLAGGGLRRMLYEEHRLRVLEDWSDAPASFDAAVYPALVVTQRTRQDPEKTADVSVALHRRQLAISWRTPQSTLPLDQTPGAPWLVLPPGARHAFDRLLRSAVPLIESGLGRPTLGVKCGCNDAFLVRYVASRQDGIVVCRGTREGVVEESGLRPLLRGETTRAWRGRETMERIVFPCDEEGHSWRSLPPGVRDWLLPHRRALLQRSDVRSGTPWWSVFRTEGAGHRQPRVVWADVARVPQALVLPAGDRTVPLNTCYVVRCRDLEDAFALTALLNSAIAAAWLGAIAEPARGGYRRFLAWTVARLPIPDDWARARPLLASFGAAGFVGTPVARQELLEATLDAYRVRRATMAPLLEWMSP